MDDMEPLPPLRREDWVVFWGVACALAALLVFVMWLNGHNRGDLNNRCLPDATCKHPALVCREYRERGDWRCVPPLDDQK